jgi:hypothetical protein
MIDNPRAEDITPGLEVAMYLHWISLYEHDPKRFAALEPKLPELRKHLADYLSLTAREIEAHLELMSATQPGGSEAVGTRDFRAADDHAVLPGGVRSLNAQFGLNWVLLSFSVPTDGGKPWGYHVYRTDKKSRTAPLVLVATVVEPEALLREQPQRVKFYYSVRAFNGAGEGPADGDYGLMLNDLEENESSSLSQEAIEQSTPNFPEHEMPIRRELGEAMMQFVQKLTQTRLGNAEEDSVMRQVATEEYRRAVEKAARQNIEVSMAWHTLATWTEDGKERIGYFARALECQRADSAATPPKTAKQRWCALHMEASCLFEIGRVHFHEGSPEAAGRFLKEALPLAQQADALQAEAEVGDDRLEGRIAELLLQLPEDGPDKN